MAVFDSFEPLPKREAAEEAVTFGGLEYVHDN